MSGRCSAGPRPLDRHPWLFLKYAHGILLQQDRRCPGLPGEDARVCRGLGGIGFFRGINIPPSPP